MAHYGIASELQDSRGAPGNSQWPLSLHAPSVSQAEPEEKAPERHNAGWLEGSEVQVRQQDEVSGCQAAAWSKASAHTPQELADHLDKLKKEFRQIYSTLLDGDAQHSQQQQSALLVSYLV